MCTFAMAACCTQTVAAHRVLSGSMTCTAHVAAKATSLACPFRLISGRVSLHARALFGVAVFCLARWVLLKDPSKQGRHHYNMLVGSSDRALLTHTTCAPRHHLVNDIELFLCLCVHVSFNPQTPHSFPTQLSTSFSTHSHRESVPVVFMSLSSMTNEAALRYSLHAIVTLYEEAADPGPATKKC